MPDVVFGVAIDDCIDAMVGTIAIGWIGIHEGTYTPVFYDINTLQQRTWDHSKYSTLEDAKTWIMEQWEETKYGLGVRNQIPVID